MNSPRPLLAQFAAVLAFASVTFAFPQHYQSVTFGSPHPGHPAGGHPGHHYQSGPAHHVTPHHVTPKPYHATPRPPYHGPPHPSPYPASAGYSYANSPYSRPHVAAHAPRPIPHVSVAKIPAHVPHPHSVPAVPNPKVVSHTPIRASTQSSSFNPSRNAANSINTDFGSFPNQGINPEQRATYLPVLKALLKVMESSRTSTQDINTLMVLTRDLNKKVPKDQDPLGNFGNFGSFGNFGINNLESMGIPATGDVIVNVDGIPHIRTEFGTFPLSSTSLMTDQERAQFLPMVRSFTRALEKGSTDANENQLLLQQAKELGKLIPENLRKSIEGLTDGAINNFF